MKEAEPPQASDRAAASIDARVLGQMLAATNLLAVLPGDQQISAFFAEALRNVPGVASSLVCLEGVRAPARTDLRCDACPLARLDRSTPDTIPVDLMCGLVSEPESRAIAVRTNDRLYGYFVIWPRDEALTALHWPFLGNLAGQIALTLENRMQRRMLEASRDDLERRVQERTRELSTANEALEASRQAATEAMQLALEEKGRAVQAEAELRQLNATLEERVAARTAELKAAYRELEAFSYSVSHDLRGPLQSIDGFGEILLTEHAEQLDAEGRRVLDIVLRNTKRMDALIDSLLSLSRLSRRECDWQPVDMDALARDVIHELLATEPETTAIEFDIGELGTIRGDETLLRQVWVNLIGNSIKFSRPVGKPRIRIQADRRDGFVQFTVADNGVGFDPAFAQNLFKPFRRLHSVTEFEGTGIGLATVERIVQRHGGRVVGNGVPGGGATFAFSLPAGGGDV